MSVVIKPLMTANFDDAEYAHEVAELKRALELWTMVPGFEQQFGGDAAGTLKKYGVDCQAESVRILTDRKTAAQYIKTPELLPREVRRYSGFINEKLRERDAMRLKDCVPKNELFRIWRERQMSRCWEQLGERSSALVHVPIIFELSDGCSVGCPFCGLASGRLQSVFRYTPEHAALWRGVLAAARDIIGDAAGTGTCYYASEGFDCPDYELFVEDYYGILGHIPQLTTAVALRDVERTRAFLAWSRSKEGCIHRFSVLSLDNLRRIHEAFTPEELLLVELLPQFAQAPSNGFVKVGRARSAELGTAHPMEENTISCCSGFVVNMARGDIRLIAPCPSSNEHPTGEILLSRRRFGSAEEFRRLLEAMITENMTPPPDEVRVLRLRGDIRAQSSGGNILLSTPQGGRLLITPQGAAPRQAVLDILEHLRAAPARADEAAAALLETKGIRPEHFFYIVNLLCRHGLCFESYETETAPADIKN